MDGYSSSSYGDAFADVYDEWYAGVSDVDATIAFVAGLAGGRGRVLELGVGTGRLAVPMAEHGLTVTGVDASTAMLDRLRDRAGAGSVRGHVEVVVGDMVDDLPDGPFDVALIAYNTLFNLPSEARQAACFAAVAGRLVAGGTFVVEAFVPEDPARQGSRVEVRSMTVDEVILSVSLHDAAEQRASGQFVHLADGRPVRLRPWTIRYSTPAQLDAMAAAAGLELADRFEDVTGAPFDDDSPRHLSVYRGRD